MVTAINGFSPFSKVPVAGSPMAGSPMPMTQATWNHFYKLEDEKALLHSVFKATFRIIPSTSCIVESSPGLDKLFRCKMQNQLLENKVATGCGKQLKLFLQALSKPSKKNEDEAIRSQLETFTDSRGWEFDCELHSVSKPSFAGQQILCGLRLCGEARAPIEAVEATPIDLSLLEAEGPVEPEDLEGGGPPNKASDDEKHVMSGGSHDELEPDHQVTEWQRMHKALGEALGDAQINSDNVMMNSSDGWNATFCGEMDGENLLSCVFPSDISMVNKRLQDVDLANTAPKLRVRFGRPASRTLFEVGLSIWPSEELNAKALLVIHMPIFEHGLAKAALDKKMEKKALKSSGSSTSGSRPPKSKSSKSRKEKSRMTMAPVMEGDETQSVSTPPNSMESLPKSLDESLEMIRGVHKGPPSCASQRSFRTNRSSGMGSEISFALSKTSCGDSAHDDDAASLPSIAEDDNVEDGFANGMRAKASNDGSVNSSQGRSENQEEKYRDELAALQFELTVSRYLGCMYWTAGCNAVAQVIAEERAAADRAVVDEKRRASLRVEAEFQRAVLFVKRSKKEESRKAILRAISETERAQRRAEMLQQKQACGLAGHEDGGFSSSGGSEMSSVLGERSDGEGSTSSLGQRVMQGSPRPPKPRVARPTPVDTGDNAQSMEPRIPSSLKRPATYSRRQASESPVRSTSRSERDALNGCRERSHSSVPASRRGHSNDMQQVDEYHQRNGNGGLEMNSGSSDAGSSSSRAVCNSSGSASSMVPRKPTSHHNSSSSLQSPRARFNNLSVSEPHASPRMNSYMDSSGQQPEQDSNSPNFDGEWQLCSKEFCAEVSSWVASLSINGDNVTDAEGTIYRMKFKGGQWTLAGGVLELEGDQLHRIGKRGGRLTYRRASSATSSSARFARASLPRHDWNSEAETDNDSLASSGYDSCC